MKKDKYEDLLNKAMELEDLLINAKEGKWLNEDRFNELKDALEQDSEIITKVPSFVFNYESLTHFLSSIKHKYRSQSSRRNFIRNEFEDLINYLQEQAK